MSLALLSQKGGGVNCCREYKQAMSLLVDEEEDLDLSRRGVLYMARVPPRMGPSKVKSLLAGFGEIPRIFLQEEDASVARRRKKQGKRGKHYVEGWIEFAEKKIAKSVARSLNNTAMGNVKKGRGTDLYAYDMWNLKYLKGFTWDHLREKIAFERRIRSQKLKLHVAAAKKSNADYVDLVDQGKTIRGIAKRKADKRGDDDDDAGLLAKHARRHFHQTKAAVPRDSPLTFLDDL